MNKCCVCETTESKRYVKVQHSGRTYHNNIYCYTCALIELGNGTFDTGDDTDGDMITFVYLKGEQK